jgi:hypothetical protein
MDVGWGGHVDDHLIDQLLDNFEAFLIDVHSSVFTAEKANCILEVVLLHSSVEETTEPIVSVILPAKLASIEGVGRNKVRLGCDEGDGTDCLMSLSTLAK